MFIWTQLYFCMLLFITKYCELQEFTDTEYLQADRVRHKMRQKGNLKNATNPSNLCSIRTIPEKHIVLFKAKCIFFWKNVIKKEV